MKKVILDMDPGVDDAAAISVAVNHLDLDIQLITTVAGNVSVEKTTNNTLKLLEFFNRTDIPVAKGAAKPLKKEFKDASEVHGVSGMPGYDFPEPKTAPIEDDAVTAIHDVISKLGADEKITIIATGSYTNIALFIQKYPEDLSKIEEFILMGGSVSGGNVSSVAEFNVFTDPDAAKIVFDELTVPKTMIGLDVTLKALITKETLNQLLEMGEAGVMLHGIINAYNDVHEGGKPMHDVNTILYAVTADKIQTEPAAIDVVVDGPAIGATVWDFQYRWHKVGFTNANVGIDIDAGEFNQWFLQQVSNMKVSK